MSEVRLGACDALLRKISIKWRYIVNVALTGAGVPVILRRDPSPHEWDGTGRDGRTGGGSMTTGTTAVVSSAHLAAGASPALSELEFALTLAATAYQRWIVRCAAAAGAPLSVLEVLIVHTVRHRDRPKRLADITLVLDIEDTHLATYALRKLEAAGLVSARKAGKEKLVAITPKGIAFCDAYHRVRESVLVAPVTSTGPGEEMVSAIAAHLRLMSGAYTQAARAAATL